MERWETYTAKEIKPTGWLRRQLELQAEGLSGHLDLVWPDVRDSAWIGGNREGWERVPYWLDGFIPLAYLLEDEALIARAKKYIDAILAQQKPDGWICPCTDEERATYDLWAVLLISKVLTVYYECSGDARIPEVLTRVLRNFYDQLADGRIHLASWGWARWFEGMIAIEFLWKRSPQPWLRELAGILRAQGLDYDAVREKWKTPLNRWQFDTHIVNMGMMLKSEAVSCELLDEPYRDLAQQRVDVLERYNGTPVGLFTGDECLSGRSPIQGTELCAVVEQMYSYEKLYAATGDPKWAERLEVLAFNALPATISDDMWAHQYDQMSNQIACEKFPGKPVFRTNGAESHLFGLEPNYGCCTANYHQGWPKFVLSAFLRRENVIQCAHFLPCTLQDGGISIAVDSEYPFRNGAKLRISADSAFTLRLRIPAFAENAVLDGKPVQPGYVDVAIEPGEREIALTFRTTPHFERRPYDLYTAVCGALRFSVQIPYETRMLEYERDGVERKFPYCDYELLPKDPWAFGYAGDALTVEEKAGDDVPFSSKNPRVVLRAAVCPIPWGLEDGYTSVCAKLPAARVPIGAPQTVELYPYGCAKLRMTELPMVQD